MAGAAAPASTLPNVETRQPSSRPPRNATERKLCDLWQRVLDVKDVGPQTNFFELGGYSLNVVRLFAELNREFKTSLPFTLLFEAPTIERLAAAIERRDRLAFSCTVPVQPKGTQPPLFMIQSYLIYDALSRGLGADQPFYGMLEPPARHRKPPYRLEDLASLYADAIERVHPDGPYSIAGWCAAGIVALEVARQLEARGKHIHLLGLIDAWCPVLPPGAIHIGGRKPIDQQQILTLGSKLKGKLLELGERAHRRVWRKLAARYLDRGQALPRFLEDSSELTLESIRRFRPRPVTCPIVVFRAEAQDFRPYEDEWCGWKPWTQNGVELVPVPGNHLSMFHEPQLSITAERIRTRLMVEEPCIH
jgi:thioesterase domain-containing protein/acyl carrier protein